MRLIEKLKLLHIYTGGVNTVYIQWDTRVGMVIWRGARTYMAITENICRVGLIQYVYIYGILHNYWYTWLHGVNTETMVN